MEHSQLRGLGMGTEVIRHRVTNGRLHRLTRGVYAVGRPDLTDRGRWMAAVLACGPHAILSHRSAAALLGLCKPWRGQVEVVVPGDTRRRRPGIRAYRRIVPEAPCDPGPPHSTVVDGIPVTGPAVTLVDLATCLQTGRLEAAVNEADHPDLIDPEVLRVAIDGLGRRPGARRLRALLDSATRALTTTELERRFLPLVREAGLPVPETQAQLGYRVDFYWAELGLVVETDSLRYHRTAFKQAADKRRDNAHVRAGLTTLRFTHGQVSDEPGYVLEELRTMARQLAAKRAA